MIPAAGAEPSPKRKRRETHIGTCQICGKRFVVIESVSPPLLRDHGYETIAARKERVPCQGSQQPPLELDSSHGETTLRFLKQQVAGLMERKATVEAGNGPPPGLSGLKALKVRFSEHEAYEIAEAQRKRDTSLAQVKINSLNTDISRLTRILALREAKTELDTPATLRLAGLPRIGDLFRWSNDGKLYKVESTVPAPRIGNPARRPVKAPHYLCRRQSDNTLHRFLQATITRALNEQGGSLPAKGRPQE